MFRPMEWTVQLFHNPPILPHSAHRDMSQNNGVSPQASIGLSPQPNIAQTTTSNPHPSASALEHTPSDTRVPPSLSSDSDQPSTSISKQVHIPRLSPATTELLAQVTASGNRQGEKRERNNSTIKNSNCFGYYFIGGRTGGSNTMRFSSAFIDLPTVPFGASNTTAAASGVRRRPATPPQENDARPAGLVNVAPNPLEEPSSVQSKKQSQAAPSPTSTAEQHEEPSIRPKSWDDNYRGPAGLVSTSPKPNETTQTSVPQVQTQLQSQAASTTSPTAEQEEVSASALTSPKEEDLRPSKLECTSPKSVEAQSASGLQVRTQSPQAISSTLTAERQKASAAPFTPSQGNNAELDYKHVETPLASRLQVQQPQLQDTTPITQTTSPTATAAARPGKPADTPALSETNNTRPTEPAPIGPKPLETSARVHQIQSQIQATEPVDQAVSSAALTAEQQITAAIPLTLPGGNNLLPSTLVPIALSPADSPSTSLPHAQSQLQNAAPITQFSTSTTTLARPRKAPLASRQRKSATNAKRGRKRKRGHDSDNEVIRAGDSSSDESDIAPTATQTKSGRQINRPSVYVPSTVSPVVGKGTPNPPNASNSMAAPLAPVRKRRRAIRKGRDTNVNCVHCQRGHSPLTNTIVFCDECNKAWHQLCHNPPIDNEVVMVAEKEWLCRGCKPVPLKLTLPSVIRNNLALGPPVHPPLPVSQAEVGGEGYSKDERRGYLSSLSHATLVELLVTLSDRNPSVPMFPANLRSLPASIFPYHPNAPVVPPSLDSANTPTSGSTVQPENSTSSEQEANKIGLNQSPNPQPAPAARRRRYDESSDESEYEEVEDHRLYPRVGNGFRLSLNTDDLDILQEDPACPTFSYALHGPAKARAEANEAAPVWGAA